VDERERNVCSSCKMAEFSLRCIAVMNLSFLSQSGPSAVKLATYGKMIILQLLLFVFHVTGHGDWQDRQLPLSHGSR